MNKDSILGKAKEIAGTMEKPLGKAVHSEKMATAGRHAQDAGREQSAAGYATHAPAGGRTRQQRPAEIASATLPGPGRPVRALALRRFNDLGIGSG